MTETAERDVSRHRARSGRAHWVPLGVLAAAAGLVAVSASSSSVLAPLRHGRPDRLAMLVTVGVIVAVGTVAAVLVVLVLHLLVLRHRPGSRGLGGVLRPAVPVTVVALALLALAGIARTGMRPAASSPPTRPSDGQAGGSAAHPAGTARLGDYNHDGRPDIGLDVDGDGRIDHVAVRSSGSAAQLSGGGWMYLERRDGRWIGAVDTNGDGRIDGYVSLGRTGDGSRGASGSSADRYLHGLPPAPAGATPPAGRAGTDGNGGTGQRAGTGAQQQADAPHSTSRHPFAGVNTTVLGWVVAAAAGAVVLALLAAATAAAVRRLPRARKPAPAEPPDELATAYEAMAVTVADSIDAMLADPDPRTAIIGAYARMLEGLAACGLARHDHEAPMEHLRRVLRELQVREEPLRWLTALFERARFSTHPPTMADRDAALDALRQAGSDLATMAPGGAA